MDCGFKETPRPGTVAGKSPQETPRAQEVLRSLCKMVNVGLHWRPQDGGDARVMRNLPRIAAQGVEPSQKKESESKGARMLQAATQC